MQDANYYVGMRKVENVPQHICLTLVKACGRHIVVSVAQIGIII